MNAERLRIDLLFQVRYTRSRIVRCFLLGESAEWKQEDPAMGYDSGFPRQDRRVQPEKGIMASFRKETEA